MEDLHTILKERTAAIHTRLEGLPFFSALHEGTLPRPAIISFLRCLSIVHSVLERCLADVSDERIAELGRLVEPKTPLLVADLAALEAGGAASITPAILAALDLGDEVLRKAGDPLSLVGALFVLEGSQNGGTVLKSAYARCLGTDPDRISYFGCYGKQAGVRWKTWVGRMNALDLDPEGAEKVGAAAVGFFERIEKICAALYPYSERDLKYHVAAVNFEAGDHIMPRNPLEIALALRAGRKAWEKYPYLELRFGERGKRFTSSDSCWLVALTRLPEGTVLKNLKWLRPVLSARGLPTVILEEHLRRISSELRSDLGATTEQVQRFDPFLASLEAERQEVVNRREIQLLVEEFDGRLRSSPGFTVESAAGLIASAWMDERSGIPGALDATRGWFVDPQRFSGEWISSAVDMVASLERAGNR